MKNARCRKEIDSKTDYRKGWVGLARGDRRLAPTYTTLSACGFPVACHPTWSF